MAPSNDYDSNLSCKSVRILIRNRLIRRRLSLDHIDSLGLLPLRDALRSIDVAVTRLEILTLQTRVTGGSRHEACRKEESHFLIISALRRQIGCTLYLKYPKPLLDVPTAR